MIKTTSPYDWNFQQAPVTHIKVARAGIGSNDFKEFVKSAGDEAAHRFKKIAHFPGEEYLHLLAMGATEVISPNRNGDGWTEEVLLRSHPTFTKNAWWHRNHKVEEDDGVYGKVRADWYNRKMGRVELIVGLFSDKASAKAANAKRGRAADKEIHMLDKGVEIPVSMSGTIDHDNCSGCGHSARGRKEYCRGYGMCKYGGLYDNIGKVFEDGHHLHAINPDTNFFDISGIYDENTLAPDKQADRIAYVMGRIKSAAAAVVETPTVPWWTYQDKSVWFNKQARILPVLCRLEKQASLTYHGSALTDKATGDLMAPSTRRQMNDLAKKGICLSLSDFGTLCGVPVSTIKAAAYYAKTAFARLSDSWLMNDVLDSNPFRLEASGDHLKEHELFSVAPEAVRKRAWLDVIENRTGAEAPVSEDPVAEAVADLHAVYRLGFAASLEKSANLDLLFSNIARHNRFQ